MELVRQTKKIATAIRPATEKTAATAAVLWKNDLGAESAPPDAMGVGDGKGVVAMMEVIVITPPPILVVGVLIG
jgi:hypothetical protein